MPGSSLLLTDKSTDRVECNGGADIRWNARRRRAGGCAVCPLDDDWRPGGCDPLPTLFLIFLSPSFHLSGKEMTRNTGRKRERNKIRDDSSWEWGDENVHMFTSLRVENSIQLSLGRVTSDRSVSHAFVPLLVQLGLKLWLGFFQNISFKLKRLWWQRPRQNITDTTLISWCYSFIF